MSKKVKTWSVPSNLAKNRTPLNVFLFDEIERIGIDGVQKFYGVTEASIYHWARLVCLPRSKQMEMIVKASKGKVSYASMVETFNRAKKKV